MTFGLDWFVLNGLFFRHSIFIPLQLLIPRRKERESGRFEWREDLFYYLVSSMMVQCLTYVPLWQALQLTAHTNWGAYRGAISSQALWLQFIEIMLISPILSCNTVHRAFQRVPKLWNFHAVHQ